ncbi:MAG: glutathione-dependent formaldehyde dehydrogenase [Myxococcota bacterium]|nr:glutathione-dependent formaldehyde dehydrogenase [Myxococcota bacterium]
MLALTYRGKGRVRVENKPEPAIEHPNDVILKVTRTAICGSDLHLFHGLVPDTRVGCTFGHEFAGVVEEVGPSVASLQRGDRVVVPFNIACGTCFFCQRGFSSACENTNPCSSLTGGCFGYSHTTGGYEGGQAELVRVPFGDVGPMKIPSDMSEEDVLFLSDILPTGYQAAEMGSIKPGETVVVFGCGPVGIFTQKAATLMGAGRVIAVDHLAYRLEFAKQFTRGIETIDFGETKDVVGTIRRMTDGRGADVCIDAVGCEAAGSLTQSLLGAMKLESGAPTAIGWAIEATRRCGHVVLIGVYGPPYNVVNIGTAMNKGLTLRMGQCNVKRYMPHLLEHIRQGRIDARAVISHRFPLEEAAEAYRIFEKKEDGCVKCVLIPPQARAA